MSIFSSPPWKNQPFKIDLTLKHTSSSFKNYKFQKIEQKYSGYEIIYTDGSKQNENVGFAVIKNGTPRKYKLPPYTTIYTAELQAIGKALHLSISSNHPKILICSDSISALQSIANINKTGPTLNKIDNYIEILSNQKKKINFLWTPGHSGIPGNEAADKAAKEAARMNTPPIQIYELNDIKAYLKDRVRKNWESMWAEIPLSNKLRNIKKTTKQWVSAARGNRREEVVLTRMRIGHTNLTHIHLIKKEVQPNCETCQTPLTIQHIIEECTLHQQAFANNNVPRSTEYALKDSAESIDKIIKLLKETQIYNRI